MVTHQKANKTIVAQNNKGTNNNHCLTIGQVSTKTIAIFRQGAECSNIA